MRESFAMRVAIILVSLMTLATSAQSSGCGLTTSHADVDTGALAGVTGARHYVADDCFLSWCTAFGLTGITVDGTVYVYEESNGIDGLQRADEVHDDTCGGTAGPGDTIIF